MYVFMQYVQSDLIEWKQTRGYPFPLGARNSQKGQRINEL